MCVLIDLLLVGESAVLVRIEELDEFVRLALQSRKVAVVSQVVAQIVRRGVPKAIPVDALEGGVWREVSNVAEALAGALKLALSIAHGNQHAFQSVFGFVTEHFYAKGDSRD